MTIQISNYLKNLIYFKKHKYFSHNVDLKNCLINIYKHCSDDIKIANR